MEKVRGSPGNNWAETKSDRDKNWTIKLSPAIIQFEVWKLRDKSSGHWHVPTGRKNFWQKKNKFLLRLKFYQQVCVWATLIVCLMFVVGCLYFNQMVSGFFSLPRPPPPVGQWLLTTVRVFYLVQCQCPGPVIFQASFCSALSAQFW